ncbi:MAG: EFR1 family ferrodoxin [Phycisphaerae bacterium]
MNTLLYWFSGTGNSLAIARALAAKLGEGVELAPMARAIKGHLEDMPAPECIGLVYPVYAFGPPRIVADFAGRLKAEPSTFIFTVATCGSTPGAAHSIIRGVLKRRGLRLAAGWTVRMPGNCITLYPSPPEEKQKKLFGRTTAAVDRIARGVAIRRRGALQDTVPPFNWLMRPIWRMGVRHFASADRKFRATDACTHCGLCERICPVENVRLVDKRPQWLGHCEQCMACIQFCPVEAIQYGRKTAGRKRYHHPAVAAKDLCVR